MSHTLQDEWGKHEESRKGPEYKEMCYLTFALVTELEHFIFEKCSFDLPPISHPSPLRGQAFSRFEEYLQRHDPLAPAEPEQHRPLLEEGYGPGESPKAIPLHFQHSRGPNPVEIPKIMDIA